MDFRSTPGPSFASLYLHLPRIHVIHLTRRMTDRPHAQRFQQANMQFFLARREQQGMNGKSTANAEWALRPLHHELNANGWGES